MKNYIKSNPSIIYIFVICIATAIIQACGFPYWNKTPQTAIAIAFALIFLVYTGSLLVQKKAKSHLFEIIIVGSMLLHAWYVLNTGINDRQHDEGYITTLEDTSVNLGHLGYIEYIFKHHHLPDFNPFEVFSFYHPPVHHIIAAISVAINLALKVDYTLAFENVQALTLLYFGLTLLITKSTLIKMNEIMNNGEDTNNVSLISIALVAFHPSLVFMSASVNNDMITLLFEAATIYYTVCYIKKKDLKTLIAIALTLGIGTICKMNAAIFACPIGIIFLMHFIDEIKAGNVWQWIRNYIIFGLICAPIGLSYTVRNALLFSETPGVPTPGVDGISYTGSHSYLTRFGLPTTLDLGYPFYSPYGKDEFNTWLIFLKTGLFSEVRPDVKGISLLVCQLIMILAVICCLVFSVVIIYTGIKMIQKKQTQLGIFQLVSFVTIIITFIAFCIIYPYTCSADFRYIPVILITVAIAFNHKVRYQKALALLSAALLVLSNFILFFYCI